MDDATRQRMQAFLLQAMDHDNSADMETFGRNFLNNGKIWDLLADHFPDARSSDVRSAMMQAFKAWQDQHGDHDPEQCRNPHHHH